MKQRPRQSKLSQMQNKMQTTDARTHAHVHERTHTHTRTHTHIEVCLFTFREIYCESRFHSEKKDRMIDGFDSVYTMILSCSTITCCKTCQTWEYERKKEILRSKNKKQ